MQLMSIQLAVFKLLNEERVFFFFCPIHKTVPNAEVLAEPYYRVWHCVKSRQTGFKYDGGREREAFFSLRETLM